jgi:hypothetical protein
MLNDQKSMLNEQGEKERKTKKQRINVEEHDICKLSKNMEYIVQQEIASRGVDTTLMKSNEFSHLIIKAVQDDEKMYLIAMVKRLQQCCQNIEKREED